MQILKIREYLASVKNGQFVPIDFNYTTVYEHEKYGTESIMDIYKVRRLKDDEKFVSDIDKPLVKYTWIGKDRLKMNRIIYIDHFYDDFIHVEMCAWTFSDCYQVSYSIEEEIEINSLDEDYLEALTSRAAKDSNEGGFDLSAIISLANQ